jgi:muramoyltetrapeptide carboxypeptidase
MIKPKRLQKDDVIGLVAPASFITQKQLEKSKKIVDELGFKPYHTDQIFARNGYLAGNDSDRAKDLMHMFENDEVKGILCIRGGYGVARILQYLDFDFIKKHPKPLIGYSDITVLLHALYNKSELICYHGPLGISEFTPYTFASFYNILISAEEEAIPVYTDILKDKSTDFPSYNSYIIRGGTAEGELTGGNLSLLTSMIGTEYEIKSKEKILFLEEIGEEPYRIDRMLTQLLLSGILNKVNGIALGIFKDCQAKNPDAKTLTLREVLTERLYGLGIPVYYGLPIGHIPFNTTIPIGIQGTIDADAMTLTIVGKAVDLE